MRLRHLAVLAAAGLFIAPALADKRKSANAPETVPPPRIVVPPLPCGTNCPPQITLPSQHYLEGPLTSESSDLRKNRMELHRFWMNNQPSTLTYERLHGAIERTVLKSYSVADLVTPASAGTCCPAPADSSKTRGAELIKKIIANVEPKSWSSAGGRGAIEYYPLGLALVVDQSHDVHEKVEQFLEQLRQVQDKEVATQLLLVFVPDAWFEKCGLAKVLCRCDAECAANSANQDHDGRGSGETHSFVL